MSIEEENKRKLHRYLDEVLNGEDYSKINEYMHENSTVNPEKLP